MSAFASIRVLPSHGRREARLQWTMVPGSSQGTFTIERAYNATQGWKVIGQVKDTDTFLDPDFVLETRTDEYFYRVTWEDRGRRETSQSVASFGSVDRQTFGRAVAILWKESQVMRAQGSAMLILRQRLDGQKCPVCVDPDTGQQIGTTLCTTCFGTGYDGGFHPAIPSWMRMLAPSPKAVRDNPEGQGSDDTNEVTARLLGIPTLVKGDMIVEPKSDQRYLVQVLTPYELRDGLAVFYEGPLMLLRRSDVRYKFPLPPP